MTRVALSIFAVLGFALHAFPSEAAAQCRLCNTPAATAESEKKETPLELRVEAKLDFASLIVLGSGSGSATLRPDGGRTTTGILGDISGRAMVGSVSVRGEPGRAVRVELPRTLTLHSLSGGQVMMDELKSDLGDLPRLDSAGNLKFRFGGRLRVTGDADGDYRGELPITVEYL